MGKLWQQQARELGGEELVEVIEDMAGDIHDIKTSVQTLTDAAFPGGDIEGHRRYHELIIERNAEMRRLRIAIQEKTISGLIWAALVFVGLSVWHTIKQKINGGF